MLTETYKGRKIRIVKGRGRDFGYSRVTLNGTELGRWLGDEARVSQSLHGYIDVTDRTGINGDKYGVEWYAPGTFEVCENGHPKEIGGECRHSYCIDRRPVAATEPTTPRPAMKRINVTPKMVEALENTIEINGKRGMIMSHPKTQAALVPRGLADENGYLTDQGRFVAHLLALGTKDRAWSWDGIEAGTRTWLSDQKRHAEAAKPKTIKRVVNGRLMEMPAHRETAPTLEDIELDSDAADREEARREAPAATESAPVPETCDSVTREGMSVHACYLPAGHDRDHTNGIKTWPVKVETPAVTEYSVKIWYRSGAYEGAPHCPEELARKIYADAVKSDGVEFAELHGPSGMLVESKTPNEESPVTAEPEQPTENLFLAGLPLLHPEPLPPAPLNVSQHGEDLTAAYSAQDPADG